MARLAMTSLAFVLVDVPEPVWYTSIGNWSSSLPSTTSCAAAAMARARRRGRRPSSRLACADARLTMPRARRKRGGSGWPEMGKFSTARCVEAP